MDKDNVVRSSKFFMAKGDVLHILLKDWTCNFHIGLVDGDGTTEAVVPVEADTTELGFVDIEFGLLYNWFAIDDVRNIAPEGWHVPTRDEFVTLYGYLGGNSIAGGKLKELGLTYWNSPNTSATNEVSFNGRGTGYRHEGGQFQDIGKICDLWSSSEYPAAGSYYHIRLNYSNAFFSGLGTTDATRGHSLRLIKDDSVNPGYVEGNDGKVYPTVKIGNQVWMACNSAETMYRTGADIPEVTGAVAWAALATGAMCAYDNNWDNVGDVDPISVLIDSVDVEIHPDYQAVLTITNEAWTAYVGSDELDLSFFCSYVEGTSRTAAITVTDAGDNTLYDDVSDIWSVTQDGTTNIQVTLSRDLVAGDELTVLIKYAYV